MQDYHKQWLIDNKDKVAEYNNNRKCKNHSVSKREWKDCKDYFDNSCAYCGIKQENHFVPRGGVLTHQDLHKEHVIWDGENDLSNCVPACQTCNSKKHKYQLDEWYNENNSNYSEVRYNKIIRWITEDYKNYIKVKPNTF